MTRLSEWLELMLAEIARKREEVERDREERSRREQEREAADADGSTPPRR
ncbi:MAG: hypothetical protein ACT4O5_08295 [Gammaproteobacteria bacterium]